MEFVVVEKIALLVQLTAPATAETMYVLLERIVGSAALTADAQDQTHAVTATPTAMCAYMSALAAAQYKLYF